MCAIRSADWSLIGQVNQLGLAHRIVTVDKAEPAARNRFLYYPDRIHQLPNSVLSLLASPLKPATRSLLPSLLREWRLPPSPPPDDEDESVDSLIRRRFGSDIADKIVSAVMHGIYAGDSRQLSAGAVLPQLLEYERKHGGILRGMWAERKAASPDAVEIDRIKQSFEPEQTRLLERASVWSMLGGVETLSKGLMRDLRQRSNVEVRLGEAIGSVTPTEHGVEVRFHFASRSDRADPDWRRHSQGGSARREHPFLRSRSAAQLASPSPLAQSLRHRRGRQHVVPASRRLDLPADHWLRLPRPARDRGSV